MTDTPTTPAAPPIDQMTPAEATQTLDRLTQVYQVVPPADPKTPSEARARLQAATRDGAWSKRFFDGDPAARSEFKNWTELAASADGADAAAAAERASGEFSAGQFGLPASDIASAAEQLRQIGFSDKGINEVLTGANFTQEQVKRAFDWKERAMRDPNFRALFLKGDPICVREMMVANAILAAGTGRE
jgi:hypothetical protein